LGGVSGLSKPGASVAEYSTRNARKFTSVAENIFCDVSND